MQAFITGSRAYGKSRSDSDLDLVIRCDECTAETLRKLCDKNEGKRGFPCMFGILNLIICTTDEEYAVWKLGTKSICQTFKRHTSDEAKAVFDILRNMVGIVDDGLDSQAKKKGG